MRRHRALFITIVPSPYQRDLFGALAACEEVDLRVCYMEAEAPDSPWPKKPLRPFERIMPGFWVFNVFLTHPVEGFQNPIFFTATSMIGMIALGGIVIRNSLVLIEFIQDALKQDIALKEAILRSGTIRYRPIVLTAATTILGAWPITLDPVFSGLAWALIFGLFASTLFTLIIVPVCYYALNKKRLEGSPKMIAE